MIKEIFRKWGFQKIKVLMTDKADYHSKALMNAPTDMMVGASIWLHGG